VIDRDRLAREFLALAAIDAPSLHEREMADALRARLEALGATVTEDGAGAALGGNAGNLLADLPGDLPGPPLLFSGHMDTVVPCLGKKPRLDPDGRFRSDGTTVLGSDDLAGVCAILEAARSLREDGVPHRSLQIVFSVGEEIDLLGAKEVDPAALTAREGYVLDTSGRPGHAVNTAPGNRRIAAVFRGRAAHAGIAPEKGANAIAAAAEGIAACTWGRLDDRTTANVGRIEGGGATNIVPETCRVEGECRSFSVERLDALAASIAESFRAAAARHGCTVDLTVAPAFETFALDEGAPVVRRFLDACVALGIAPSLSRGGGGSDANVYVRCGVPCLVLACGMTDVHSTHESLALDDLEAVARLARELMVRA
jgi:tripeptide aminopeptidase